MTTIPTAADLGRAIRLRRRERELTLVETAELAEVGVRFMSELENGKATVRLDKVMAVIGALGLELGLRAAAAPEPAVGKPAGATEDAFGLGGLMGEVKGLLEGDD